MSSGRRHVGALLTMALMLVLVPAAGAGASVYWVNGSLGSIARANDDGEAANQRFIAGIDAAWVAVDGNHIYWTTQTTNAIGRANLDGSGVNKNFITGSTPPSGVAVDAGHIYWANYNNTIGRANLDGSGVNQSFITGANRPSTTAVADGAIYWTNSGNFTIGTASTNGSGVNQSLVKLEPGIDSIMGIAVGGGSIYWASVSGASGAYGGIGRASLDGSDVKEDFIPTSPVRGGIAVDATSIYWSTAADTTSIVGDEGIARANLDGSGVNESFITGAAGPRGVAVGTASSGPGPGPSPGATKLSLSLAGASPQALRYKNSLKATFTCDLACTVAVAARATIDGRAVATWSGTMELAAGQTSGVRFSVNTGTFRRLRAALRSRRRVRFVVVAKALNTDSGASKTRTRIWVVTLRARRTVLRFARPLDAGLAGPQTPASSGSTVVITEHR